jgi:hypothetical protein
MVEKDKAKAASGQPDAADPAGTEAKSPAE